MIAVLAEDDSDAEVLSHIIKSRMGNDRLAIRKKGYDGCGAMYTKGARDIRVWLSQGVSRFVICHDADTSETSQIRQIRNRILDAVVRPSGLEQQCCIAIPVQEMESWLIADERAISSVIPSFQFKGHDNPESIASPKEWIVRQSRSAGGKPLYVPKTFNAAVARRLRLDVVEAKCPSFREFVNCLRALARKSHQKY